MKNKKSWDNVTIVINVIGFLFVWWMLSMESVGFFDGIEEILFFFIVFYVAMVVHLFVFDNFKSKIFAALLDSFFLFILSLINLKEGLDIFFVGVLVFGALSVIASIINFSLFFLWRKFKR